MPIITAKTQSRKTAPVLVVETLGKPNPYLLLIGFTVAVLFVAYMKNR